MEYQFAICKLFPVHYDYNIDLRSPNPTARAVKMATVLPITNPRRTRPPPRRTTSLPHRPPIQNPPRPPLDTSPPTTNPRNTTRIVIIKATDPPPPRTNIIPGLLIV